MKRNLKLELLLSLRINKKYWPEIRKSAAALNISPSEYVLMVLVK